MRIYLDTSALVKLYIEEDNSQAVVDVLTGQTAATCRITYVEARAALARREREAPAHTAAWVEARRRLDADWVGFAVVEVTESLIQQAADLADAFALRGFDATQLAACHLLDASFNGPVMFCCFDVRLNRAARLLGLELPRGAPL